MTPLTSSRFLGLRAMADGSLLRLATLYNKQYIVVPIVSAVGDKVWWAINSSVPELVPAEVLEAEYWSRNNRPIVLGHPKVGGEYVSANSPDILESYCFGHLFSARFEDNRIKVEAWFDRERAEEVGPAAVEIINRLEAGEQIEVSEGNMVVSIDEKGEVDGKEYKSRWLHAICDHLAVVNKGACDNEMGCGGPRVNQQYTTSQTNLRSRLLVSALSQARTPKYTGTETSTWTRPTFADFIRYCYNGDNPPVSVTKCSAELKRVISDHTLLGDPDATNFADLTRFPVVNPANGNLNENALRSVISGKGMSGDIGDKAMASCQEIARRLLNSEFSANLEVAERPEDRKMDVNSKDKKKNNAFSRMMQAMTSAIRSAMSNNDLRMKLYRAISEIEKGVDIVWDEDVATSLFIYRICIKYGDYWDTYESDYHFYRRSFTINADGTVSIGDDPVEIEYFEGWREKETVPDSNLEAAETIDEEKKDQSQPCQCQKGEDLMSVPKVSEKKKATINQLITSEHSPFEETDRAVLENWSEEKLDAMLATCQGTGKAASKVAPTSNQFETTTPTTTSTAASTTIPTVSTVEPPKDQVTISKEDYANIMAAATAYHTQQENHRNSLISSIKTAEKNTFTEEELKVFTTPQLEKLAASFEVNSDVTVDYSVGVRPESRVSSAPKMRELPDSWGLNANANKSN